MSKDVVKNTTKKEEKEITAPIPRNQLGVNRYTTPE